MLQEAIEFIGIQTVLVLVAVFLIMVYVYQRPRNLPPGPVGWPIIGALPRMGKKPYLTVQQWWKDYGDVYSLYMGTRLCVILNGVDAMKECLVKQGDIFSARPWNYFKKITRGTGIVFTEGEVWKEHRRFTLSCLRDFGMGRVSLEEKIREESFYLMNELLKLDKRPFDVVDLIPKSVSNIICSIIYGHRFEYDDPIFHANVTSLQESIRNQKLTGLIQFLPFLEFLPKILPRYKMLAKNVKQRESYAQLQLDLHAKTLDPNHPRDFIDVYLIRLKQMRERGEASTFDERQLCRTIQDLFIAGSETVTTTLKWAYLFFALYPDVQERVQKEIDSVCEGRMPCMKDKSNMPYTEATFMECQRLGNIALFSVPRAVTQDTTVNGYHIPKGTWVFVNRWGTHVNTKYWANPKKFDPTRFLDSNGKVTRPEGFIPFGMGPRSCLGESLAKMELFLFLTCLLQRFTLRLPEGSSAPSLEPQVGINLSPQSYKVCAIPRNL